MITWTHARRSLFTTLLAGACICLTVQIATAQSPGLNVSIIVFSPGIPADASTHRRLQVFPKIREFESRLLPFVLRETLVATQAWGAVRVVPEPDPAAELYLSGEILRSDGSTLELRFVAIDASGRVWLDKSYSQLANIDLESGRPASGARAYQALFGEVEHDLRIARDSLDDKALQDIVEISLLRYATELAPTAFEGFLNKDASGRFSINRRAIHPYHASAAGSHCGCERCSQRDLQSIPVRVDGVRTRFHGRPPTGRHLRRGGAGGDSGS